MGKGVIVEHLGDAHYRIGLDIDVSYARDQLAAINLYLDEFAAKYQEATDAKNDAQAALAPINTRLTEYLADAQAASQAAYDAMVAAYDVWVDAVANQPDPGVLEPLREAMDVWFDGFATTHNDYILALDGDEQAPLPVPDALEARTHALQQLTLAMGDWLGAVGALIDPAAVNTAFDALGIALDDFESATVAYAAEPGNATLKSAMNYYQGVYETAHADWVKAVEDNSGDEAVKAARDAYDAAAETFDNAREALGKLLDNGGMPPELADIMAEQERAYATYRGALQNWQSMTLIKTEKETAKAELMSRLLPFTNNDGEPVRQSVNAWCCDYTEELTAGAEVATIEIPGERDLGVRVRPGYDSRESYSAARDGKLQPSWSSSPEATYWNWALHPGNARWHPNYRLGEILLVNEAANTCTVQLDPQRNNEKSRARDGKTLDVINPVKYETDPNTGAPTPILPGDNVQVADGVTTLTDVPIEYMECNAAIFEVGDHVMVEFQGRDWKQPKVIGFAENPRPCSTRGLGLVGSAPAQEWLIIPDHASELKIRHYGGGEGGNIEWLSADGKTCLTWDGPRGRSFAPRMHNGPYPFFYFPDDYESWGDSINAIRASNLHVCVMQTRFGQKIYRNGKLAGTAPVDWIVLGAAQMTYVETKEDQTTVKHTYLVAVLGWVVFAVPNADKLIYLEDHPEFMRQRVVYARVTGTQAIADNGWTVISERDLSDDPEILPPLNACFFSASGQKFAMLQPTVQTTDTITEQGVPYQRTNVGNDVIIRGELSADENGVTVSDWSLTWQTDNDGSQSISRSTTLLSSGAGFGGLGFGPWESSDITSTAQSGSAIVAIDFSGETEVTLSASLSVSYNSSGTASGLSTEGAPELDYDEGATLIVENQNWQLTDDYRSVVVGEWDYSRTVSATSGFSFYSGAVPGFTIAQGSTATASGSLSYPLWYDLRYGGAIYESGDGGNIYASALSGIFDGVSNAGATTGSDTTSITLDLKANADSPIYTFADNHTKSLDESVTVTAPNYGTSRENSSVSFTIGTPPDSVCNQVRPFGWKIRLNGYPWRAISIPLVYADRANTSGGVVCRILQDRYLGLNGYFDFADIFDEGDVNIPATVDLAFSNVSDINAAWQTHLNTSHPPAEGEEQFTATAIESDLTPLFRV